MQREWELNSYLKRGLCHHHGEHQKSWTFPLSKQFQLVIDSLMHISGSIAQYNIKSK